MSTRIIIEKDGERYVANELTLEFADCGRPLCVLNKLLGQYVLSTYTRLPPVIRTDNSAVISNLEAENAKLSNDVVEASGKCYKLEAENAKLREAMKPVMECNPTLILDIACSFDDACMNDDQCVAYGSNRFVEANREAVAERSSGHQDGGTTARSVEVATKTGGKE